MSRLVAILGPTATGKTELALEIGRRLDVEIVNADALQAYRGFDIGTAKPTPEERRRVPHHLVDILDATERYSAGRFAELAREVIGEIEGRGRTALVVGGSGLYLRALLEGIGPLPPSRPEVRRRLEEDLESIGVEAMWEELARRDPPTAERLPRADRQRIVRALEVHELSGKPLSRWIAEAPFGQRSLQALKIGLQLPRGELDERITQRVEAMIERGWVEEVRSLLARWKDPELPAFQAIGYRQLSRHLLEDRPLDEAIADIVTATRRFAKRQTTWFRRESRVVWYRAGDPEALATSVLRRLAAPAPRSDPA